MKDVNTKESQVSQLNRPPANACYLRARYCEISRAKQPHNVRMDTCTVTRSMNGGSSENPKDNVAPHEGQPAASKEACCRPAGDVIPASSRHTLSRLRVERSQCIPTQLQNNRPRLLASCRTDMSLVKAIFAARTIG